MRIPLEALKNFLVASGLVRQGDFDASLREAKRTDRDISEILISRGLISSEYFYQIAAEYYKVPLANLVGQNIVPEILNILPEEVARSRKAVVFDRVNGRLKIALLDPSDLENIKFLERYTQKQLEIFLATEDDLKYAFSQYRREMVESFQKLIEEQVRLLSRLKFADESDLVQAASEMPVISIVDNLISYGATLNATDVHIEVLASEVLVRFRLDGILREIARLPREIHPALVARIKIMANLQIDEHAKPQDGRIKYQQGNEVFDIRVAIMPTFYGEKITMRLLLSALKPLSFVELGMTNEQIVILERNIKKTFGMILSTGPTSSGKTTTQYSILSRLNRPEVNIVTIEDPIEYELKYINQTQVNPKAGIDFASGLRAFLRHDPNIIMVGEIRDSETAEIATHAALTGHLVLSTLHTNDAPTAVPRLIDMGVEPFLVAATVNLVMAQRLVRKICTECIETITVSEALQDLILNQLKISAPAKVESFKMPTILYHGKGCSVCGGRGYRGRLALFEFFEVTPEIRNYIVDKDFTLDGLKSLAAASGMKTMFEDGLEKSKIGLTTIEEVLRVIRE